MHSQNKFNILKEAYRCAPFQVHNTIRFTRYKDETSASYPTIHGAFIFCIQGEALISFDDETFFAKPGILVHGCPGRQLSFRIQSDCPFVHINLYYKQINSDLLFEVPVNLPQIQPALQELAEQNEAMDIHTILQKKILTQQIFQHIFYGSKEDALKGDYYYVSQILSYIKKHYSEPVSMKELADLIGKSESQMSYIFYKYTHKRPIDFLIDYRMDIAASLLREQGLRINEAAEAVGYSDSLYFSRIFKKRTGYSPSQIKK